MDPQVVVADGDLVIRRMRDHDDDYSLMVRWRNLPHVRRWWDHDLPTQTLESIREEYAQETADDSPTTLCIIELEKEPVGFTQFYRWASFPDETDEVGVPYDDDTFGLDIFIGEPDLPGKGLGTRIVTLLSDYLLDELGASSVSLTTALDNHAAQRTYEKSGFTKVREVLDTDTYRGERIPSWLMTKRAETQR